MICWFQHFEISPSLPDFWYWYLARKKRNTWNSRVKMGFLSPHPHLLGLLKLDSIFSFLFTQEEISLSFPPSKSGTAILISCSFYIILKMLRVLSKTLRQTNELILHHNFLSHVSLGVVSIALISSLPSTLQSRWALCLSQGLIES